MWYGCVLTIGVELCVFITYLFWKSKKQKEEETYLEEHMYI